MPDIQKKKGKKLASIKDSRNRFDIKLFLFIFIFHLRNVAMQKQISVQFPHFTVKSCKHILKVMQISILKSETV